MNEIIESKVNELYSLIMTKPNQVLEIFNAFFGEDKVDMQGFMSIDKFESWLDITPISEYIQRGNHLIEDYDFYKDKTLTDIQDNEILDKVLEIICDKSIVNSIGNTKFNQGFILVHFPHVRITNEYDRFVDINHLYAKVQVLHNGVLNGIFSLNRAEYPYLHISSGYMHSHVSAIPINDFTIFQRPCTGTGPINDTMASLNREFDSDLWKLFCLELSKYVQVESIAGTPYHRLENIGISGTSLEDTFRVVNQFNHPIATQKIIQEFTPHFIRKGKLKFNYIDGSYFVGMSFTEYVLTISNEFISWYNNEFNEKRQKLTFDELKEWSILKECIVAGDKIYYKSSRRNVGTFTSYNGKRMCTFKGNEVVINITGLNDVEGDNKSIILNTNIALYILSKIIRVINYRYGRTEQTDQEGNRISEEVGYF